MTTKNKLTDYSWFHGSKKKFSEFDTSGFGSHFGTLDQALSAPRGSDFIYEVDLSITNPLRLEDQYSWDPWDLCECLSELFDLDLDHLRDRIIRAQGNVDSEKVFQQEIKRVIQKLGFDGVIYQNIMEGPGSSMIAFQSDQIKILKVYERTKQLELNSGHEKIVCSMTM